MSNPTVRAARKQVKASREQVTRELERIYHDRGEVKASVVVDEAHSKDSPLHGEFEWDNAKAGHEHRLAQARALIRVTFIVPTKDAGAEPTRLVHVPSASQKDPEGAYHPVSVVVQNVDWYARALNELASKVRSATAAAEELRKAAQASDVTDGERMARITVAITALQTAGAAVQALH